VMRRYAPQVVLDLHEFTAAGRWVDKLGVVQKYDAMIQAATVGNMDAELAQRTRQGFVQRIQARWQRENLNSFAYHTTSADAQDKTVLMGGVQPDTGRNVGGLRPAVSLLVEIRGVGIGRAHLLRRVHTGVLASLETIQAAAEQGAELVQAVASAQTRAADNACQGELVVAAQHSSTRQRLEFLDAKTGEDRDIEVDWRSAERLNILRSRPRPCAYLIAPDQSAARERLQRLGVRIAQLNHAERLPVESYRLLAEDAGQRQDGRGTVDDGEGGAIRVLKVALEPADELIPPGTWYVSLKQPLSALIAAALEPDSQSSLAANRLLEPTRVWRVLREPATTALSPLPSAVPNAQ
jgi:hypothetical protein